MDETDRRLLALLSRDARASLSALAVASGVSRGTVRNRIARLEAENVIAGYTIRLAPDALAARAFVALRVRDGRARALAARLLAEPGVEALHETSGAWDLVVEVGAPSNAALSLVLDRVRAVDGVLAVQAGVRLATLR